jgi:hypothetical protein
MCLIDMASARSGFSHAALSIGADRTPCNYLRNNPAYCSGVRCLITRSGGLDCFILVLRVLLHSRLPPMRTIRVFISSSQDCSPERDAVRDIIRQFNCDPHIAAFARLQAIAWDGDIPIALDAVMSPQMSVDRQLPAPEECDIFVGIARCRFGTPVPMAELRKDDGQPYLSGTEYELTRAWQARRRGAALPHILFYRSIDAIEGSCPDDEQFARSRKFFASAPFATTEGSCGAVMPFRDTADFEEQLASHLRQIIDRWHASTGLPLAEWMRRQAARLMKDAGPRYTKAAHVASSVSRKFDWLLLRPSAIAALDSALSKLWDDVDKWEEFAHLRLRLAAVGEAMRTDPRALPDLDKLQALIEQIKNVARARIASAIEASRDQLDDWLSAMYNVSGNASRVLDLLSMYAVFARKRVMLLTGPAGQGKTHTLIHELQVVLEEGGVAAGVLCQTLAATGSLSQALLAKWDYEGTLGDFLDHLSNESAQQGRRALIVIDALNETRDHHRWARELPGLLSDILLRPNLAVALSIRDDYLPLVLPPASMEQETLWELALHMGFADVEPEALLAYCRHYEVTLPVAPPLGELENPLYLQMLMKSLQGKDQLQGRLPSWLEVWGSWMERLEHDAIGALALAPQRPQPVRRTLRRLAAIMIAGRRFNLMRSKAENEAAQLSGTPLLIDFLCSAGVLIARVGDDDREIVEFGFERLNDTFFADRLLDQLFENFITPSERRARLAAALAPGGSLSGLAFGSEGRGFLASHRPGLLAALCLAVPSKANVELAELMPLEFPRDDGSIILDSALRDAVMDSFRWRSKPDEFALEGQGLWHLWRQLAVWMVAAARTDGLIQLSLIHGHPFAFENYLHPWLLQMDSPGARDAEWSLSLVELWQEKSSNVRIVMRWACEARLDGLGRATALPTARLLAWIAAVPQRAMRKLAIEGLTRILVACPQCMDELLPDLLAVNDAYVVEALLVAVWGALTARAEHEAAARAAKLVHEKMFKDSNAVWLHLTIRHYARCIVELGIAQRWLHVSNSARIRPPYCSALPLAQVSDEEALRASDTSTGFTAIVSSACDGDFFRYVLGGTSGPKPFSGLPLAHSAEPQRPHPARRARQPLTAMDVFDLPLVARFVASQCHVLGWTAKRFNAFDSSVRAGRSGRLAEDGRTERMGKKYQWIAWQTMLGFLSDNYQMTPSSGPVVYDSPNQITYIEVLDPSRWFGDARAPVTTESNRAFWHMPSLPIWPRADMDDMLRWGRESLYELPPSDVVSTVPALPVAWGDGPWLRIAADHNWKNDFAPGLWVRGEEFLADVWWQIVPGLIPSEELPMLLEKVHGAVAQSEIAGVSSYSYDRDADTPLADWPLRQVNPDASAAQYGFPQLSVDWTPIAGISITPDGDGESGTVLPGPRLFQEWGLELDLRQGVVRHKGETVFGLAPWAQGGDALFARTAPLMALLEQYGMTLVWLLVGERRATLDHGNMSGWDRKTWTDMRGIAYLGSDGRVNTACLIRTLDQD